MIETVDQAIAVLGGGKETSELFGVLPSAVSNWKKAGRFPARLHLRIDRELRQRGHEPSAALFGGDAQPGPAPAGEAA